jgi:hypothetical protein
MFVKRRRVGGSVVIWFGNQFLALARSASCMFVQANEWVDWEFHCARLLYPERPGPKVVSGQYVVIPKVCGISLRQMLHRNEADVKAFVIAARELRRDFGKSFTGSPRLQVFVPEQNSVATNNGGEQIVRGPVGNRA